MGMQKYTGVLQDTNGNIIANQVSRVRVTLTSSGLLVALFEDDETTPLGNPLNTDSNGQFSFKALDGEYTITDDVTGETIEELQHNFIPESGNRQNATSAIGKVLQVKDDGGNNDGYGLSDQALGSLAFLNDAPSTAGLSHPINLIIENHASNPTFQVDINADEIMLSNNESLFRVRSINLTSDITVSGVNGLDTGVEAGDTWYYIWVILNGTPISTGNTDATTASKLEDSTADFVADGVKVGDLVQNTTDGTATHVAAVDDLNTLSLSDDIFVSGENYQVYAFGSLLSISSTAPTMPSGYTFKRRVGSIRNDSSSDFLNISQFGNDVSYNELLSVVRVLLNGTISQVVDCSSLIPPISRKARFHMKGTLNDSSTLADVKLGIKKSVTSSGPSIELISINQNVSNQLEEKTLVIDAPTDSSQNIYFVIGTTNSPATANGSISVLGYINAF